MDDSHLFLPNENVLYSFVLAPNQVPPTQISLNIASDPEL